MVRSPCPSRPSRFPRRMLPSRVGRLHTLILTPTLATVKPRCGPIGRMGAVGGHDNMTGTHSAAPLDPEIAEVLAAGPAFQTLNSLDELPAWRSTAEQRADLYVRAPGVDVTTHVIPSYDGVEFALRVHRAARPDQPGLALVWIHGGGFVG